MNSAGAQLRVSAARAIHQIFQGRSLKAVLAQERSAFADGRDRALLEAMTVGTVRHRRRLEFALGRFLSKPLAPSEPLSHALLLVGLTQLHLLMLAPHAAVSATVEAARELGKGAHAALINAVLRRSQREGLPASDDIGIQESHPDWLLTRLRADWPESWADIVAANNRVAPLWLRIPGGSQEREAIAAALQTQMIAHRISEIAAQAIRIDAAIAPMQLPGWPEGRIAVQDLSAQLPAIALAVKAGETVWDMCAAPGGKSAQLLEATPTMLLLTDSEADRIPKINALFARLGCGEDAAAVHALDATQPLQESLPQQFDAILLDAPCSATGIIRRQPDVKWHRREKDIGALNTLQWRLLKNAWRHLRPGGRLLYSTCSVLKAENELLIGQFLQQHADANALPLDARFGRVSGVGRQRMPGEDDGDGFYYALLHKV
ncbi:16S rRNA (cytosine(967)-C(5))-methyltransferase RsmB [Arenimonas sp.]|uniref:16S rRNA (cytosine(967)-C(5))-methyltransferase RsmB n=1 Tax=Arenimonas sp. TaxID=1872635 RepID=UPI0037BF2FA1